MERSSGGLPVRKSSRNLDAKGKEDNHEANMPRSVDWRLDLARRVCIAHERRRPGANWASNGEPDEDCRRGFSPSPSRYEASPGDALREWACPGGRRPKDRAGNREHRTMARKAIRAGSTPGFLPREWPRPGARQAKPNEIGLGKLSFSGIAVQLLKAENPLQLLNPAAPAQYGSGMDNLDQFSFSGTGPLLKIFSIAF